MISSVSMPKHPRGLYVLFFTEMWERFGFYTMMAIFTLYLKAGPETGGLGMDTTQAGSFYAIFLGLVYFTPLLGGFAADLLLGERLAIMIGALLLAGGYFALALPPGEGLGLLYLAIAGIVAGNGLFKPNISTMVGRLYPENSPLRDAGFNIFYTGINLGAVIAPLAATLLRQALSWQAAFAAAGVGMIGSLGIFYRYRQAYAGATVKPLSVSPTTRSAVPSPADASGVGFGQRLLALLLLYLVSTMFWTLFFQNGFALTLWAKDCTARPAWLEPEIFQVVNPACIVVLSSVAAWVWRKLGSRGVEPSNPDKILLGLVAATAACLVMWGASAAGGDRCLPGGGGELVSLAWLVGTYMMISLAEILVSPMGLSYCTQVAPAKLGGLVMGGWFASLAAGGYLSGFMGARYWETLSHSTYFGILAGGIAGISLVLLLVRGILKRAAGG